MLQTIIEPDTVVDAARIEEGLRDTELYHGVRLGLLHLLAKRSQLHRYIGLHLFRLLMLTGLLRKRRSFGCQFLIKGADGLQILCLLLFLYLLMLAKPTDDPLVGHVYVLEGFHLHQCLK